MIKIKDITKKYGSNIILEHCSYEFPDTGIVCLMGPSGGGKTTLLNLLAGFDTDYSGVITVGGVRVNEMNAHELCGYRRDNIGFVFQNYHLLPGYTVLENILLACDGGEDEKERQKKGKALLKRLGMEEKENQLSETLSGGQKQRAAIARALVNDPRIIFADEPTGALDRKTSTEIMTLLREISRDRLVVVITHDAKISEFADEVIQIKEKRIMGDRPVSRNVSNEKPLLQREKKPDKNSMVSKAVKNFKVHLKRYIAVSLAISIGMLAFLFSLSFGNVMEHSILEFQEKNTAFNNGYIRGTDDGTILEYLKSDERIEHVYYQYKLENISLQMDGKSQVLAEKFPTPKATQGLSYGVMPGEEMNEIAITPSLAKKMTEDIKSLIGRELTLELDGSSYTVTISGIYNAGYDDFIVSPDIEQKLYEKLPKQDNYSINYDVKEFSDIVAVSNRLGLQGLKSDNASDEVYALQNTFQSLGKLFLVLSILILGIGLFICAVLLIKLQNTRYREVGLLSALGYSRQQITGMILQENLLLSILTAVVELTLLGISIFISKLLALPLIVSGAQAAFTIMAAFAVVMVLSGGASLPLVRTEPAAALRK
ncbi:MAG: ATP-binding cassette domain-containing protein [Clostridiales bacterium]|nr:ATP-binding cassette domain-containing protein [Clostridiales bacterium]MDU3242572.1 ATP-binding cassette domain-containing protein [Clostridiales bacterium]